VNVIAYLESLSKPVVLVAGLVLIAVIGLADFASGNEIAFSVFYVLPVALITWCVGREFGLLASIASAVVWLVADVETRNPYSHQLIPLWNSLIRFAFFAIITILLAALKKAVHRESNLAYIDYLTGVANSRLFYDLAEREIERCRRYKHPFTLAYIDLDNFKDVNDSLGHVAGDEVLRSVADLLRSNLRVTDSVARLGGDEFAVLLPETDQDAARLALKKVQALLSDEMQARQWPVTFSIGALTCRAAPQSTNALVKMADELMYSAKRDGKNKIRYDHFAGENP
jgi:diguanylate cyclase (GGDEF)-like protein